MNILHFAIASRKTCKTCWCKRLDTLVILNYDEILDSRKGAKQLSRLASRLPPTNSLTFNLNFLLAHTCMRLALVKSVLACGLLLLVASPALAERLEATNSSAVSVDGVTRSSGPPPRPVTRTVLFTGAESAFGTGIIEDVDIEIDFSKLSTVGENPLQPWYNEIGFALRSPGGTLVELIPIGTFLGPPNFNGTSGFSGIITLDDAAAQAVNNGPTVGSPNAGTFQPMNALSAFNGENALGTWELWIEDSVGAHPLQFNAFTLSIQTAAVPEPGSVILGGMSLLALGGVVWRKRRARS